MADGVDVALVGATGPLGEALLERLAESALPLGRVHLLDAGEAVGRRIAFRDHHEKVEDLAAFDFSSVAFSLFAVEPRLAAEHAPRAAAAGGVVIDTSAAFRDDPRVPLVVADLNPEALAGMGPRRIVAMPGPASVIMLSTLAPLHAAAGLVRVEVVSLEAVSGAGAEGVEELATETAFLLNARPVTPAVFRQQIAFNVIPQVGPLDADGHTPAERDLARDAGRVLVAPDLELTATAVQVPVFFGHGLVLHVETREPLGPARAAELLAAAPGIEVRADGAPSAVVDAADGEAIVVGRLRGRPQRLEMWAVADNLRRAAAVNCVQIFQILVQEQL